MHFTCKSLAVLSAVITCPARSSPSNGNVELTDDANFGSVAVYTCDEGYVFTDTSVTVQVCEEDSGAATAPFGAWSALEPACQSEYQKLCVHRFFSKCLCEPYKTEFQ